jgi:peptidoglycan/xylan/chitin deacetylase (PgdA/CDA1 family)
MYHHIAPAPRNAAPVDAQYFVDPAAFDQQIFYALSNGYTPVLLSQVVDALTGGPGLPPKPVAFTVDDGWQDFYQNGLPVAKKYAIPVTLFAIADADRNSYMNPAERWALAHSGFEVEAHTLTHPFLTRLLSTVANSEIVNSRKALEKELGLPVQLFAYPYGDYNKPIQAMVQAAGYRAAFAAGPANDEDNQHLLALPRVMVSRYDSMASFSSKLADYRWARTHFTPLPGPPPVAIWPSPAPMAAPAPAPIGEGTGARAGPATDVTDSSTSLPDSAGGSPPSGDAAAS